MFEEIGSTALFLCLILLLLSLIALTLLVLLVHSGLFTSAKEVGAAKPPLGKAVVAYKFVKGPYNEAGQTFTEAHIIAPDNKCVGIYYDDPKKVASHELRYAVGSILGTHMSEVDAEMLSCFRDKGFKIITLPEVEFAVQTSFPHVTALSILIAVHKAYPRLSEYVEERKLCAHPFLEYYDGNRIHFFAPLSKQEEFWVSECQQQFDGRGDESMDAASDVNTTLDTSHSVLADDSMVREEEEDSLRATPDSVSGMTEEQGEATNKTTDDVLEVSLEKEVGKLSSGGKGSGDGGAIEDNSSSPSTLLPPGDGEEEEVEAEGEEDDDAIVGGGGGGGVGLGDDDDLDNSSSSSFELLKNEALE